MPADDPVRLSQTKPPQSFKSPIGTSPADCHLCDLKSFRSISRDWLHIAGVTCTCLCLLRLRPHSARTYSMARRLPFFTILSVCKLTPLHCYETSYRSLFLSIPTCTGGLNHWWRLRHWTGNHPATWYFYISVAIWTFVLFPRCCCLGLGGSTGASLTLYHSRTAGLHGASVAISGRRQQVLDGAVAALQGEGISAIGLQVWPHPKLLA